MMTKHSILLTLTMIGFATAQAADEAAPARPKAEVAKATYMITGLHCPPCSRTVESSLRKVKGVQSVKVDWATKNARIEFDESILPAQKVAQLIASTPHMMGGGMRYGGWLTLRVSDLNETTASRVKEVLGQLPGVKRVATYPAQQSVEIAFGSKGGLTSADLVDALSKAGIMAERL
jgi:copper chaperone CopZ